MTIDPSPFLTTVVTTSAALVAIIGGLLVAKFVGLDSDQRTSRKVLTAARERLELARSRAEKAWHDILRWDADDFFSTLEIIEAILDKGVTSTSELMRIASWPHQPDDLASFVTEVAAEADRAREAIDPRIDSSDTFWGDFRRRRRDLPEIRWPKVWEHVFDCIADERATKARAEEEAMRAAAPPKSALERELDRANTLMANMQRQNALVVPPLIPPRTDYGLIAAHRSDLRGNHARAEQQVEDLEAELLRLEQEHAEIVRPDARLRWGVIFTVLGVVVPLGIMATGPRDLAPVRWVLYPFIVSLAALIGYIVVYLVQLTRKKSDQPAVSP